MASRRGADCVREGRRREARGGPTGEAHGDRRRACLAPVRRRLGGRAGHRRARGAARATEKARLERVAERARSCARRSDGRARAARATTTSRGAWSWRRASRTARVAREHLGEDLATLAPRPRAGPLRAPRSSWGDSYESSRPRSAPRSKPSSRHAPGPPRRDAGRSAKCRRRACSRREVIEHVGVPEAFLEARLAQPGSAELDRPRWSSRRGARWIRSRRRPSRARRFPNTEGPFSRTPRSPRSLTRGWSCPAAKARTPRWCDDTYSIRELEGRTDRREGGYGLLRSPGRDSSSPSDSRTEKFDAEAFHVLCRRAGAAARDASTDAEPEEDDD